MTRLRDVVSGTSANRNTSCEASAKSRLGSVRGVTTSYVARPNLG
jgi:hypothetical protein